MVCQLQIRLPYHIPNVDSNDEIFTKDEEFKAEAVNLIDSIINYILEDISQLDTKINKSSLDEVQFFSYVCLQSAELFTKYFEESKYSNSVIKKMVELARKYLESFKNSKTDAANSYNLKALINLSNKYEF